MKIDEFIQTQILLPRLHQTGVLVVYDPERRYRLNEADHFHHQGTKTPSLRVLVPNTKIADSQ